MAKVVNDDLTPLEGKGHATPKRKEQVAKRRQSLVLDVKKDSARRREENRKRFERERQAMLTGDERNMPAQHAGPARRFARDFVDSRLTTAEFMMPISIAAMVILLFFGTVAWLAGTAVLTYFLVLIAWLIESSLLLRTMRKQAIAKFGESKLPRMLRMYGLSRMFMIRKFRMPKPQVKRGEFPI